MRKSYVPFDENNNPVIQGADATTLQYTKVSLTNAEIKALRATPITLVSAPETGKKIELISATLKLVAGTEALSETNDNLVIRYTDGTGVIVSQAIETTGFIDQEADTYTNTVAKTDSIVPATGAEAQALVLHNTGDGEFAGNASNDAILEVGVFYRVVTL